MNLIYTLNISMSSAEMYFKQSDPALIAHHTIPKMKAYADRVGADFLVCEDLLGYDDPNFVKFETAKMLEKYDRVLFLDLDIVISDSAPNIFEIVPDDKFGVYVESDDVPERLAQTEHVWDLNKLDHNGCKFMFNAGVMLFSQCHKDIIKPPPAHITVAELYRFKEQVWFNYIFRDIDLYKLGHEWNHMDLSQKPDDDKVNFRHYAASDRKKLLELLKEK